MMKNAFYFILKALFVLKSSNIDEVIRSGFFYDKIYKHKKEYKALKAHFGFLRDKILSALRFYLKATVKKFYHGY